VCKKLEILGKADVIHTARGSGLLEIRSAQFRIPLFAEGRDSVTLGAMQAGFNKLSAY